MAAHSKILLLFIFALCFCNHIPAQNHPRLILTVEGVKKIRAGLGKTPLYDEALEKAKAEVDAEIKTGIQVPVPKDLAGGYTHERHKRNFLILPKAGVLYQVLQDEQYAVYIRDVLMAYARMYPTLGLHPTQRSYATGKVFWQCLNDANWLVYVSQAYDCIYEWLKPEEREILEKQLFRPFADFISVENPRFFNRIHNQSTWGNAAVGMIGLVMEDKELVHRAFYGLEHDNIGADEKDNDGGLIKLPGQDRAGFLAQLDHSFAPDGYYTEGPYYQRYAMYPFILFAKAISHNLPELEIFEYRGQLLKKAVYALLQQTNEQGEFFPFNDAQKGMSYHSRELVAAVDIAYDLCGNDPALLSIARKQGRVLIDGSGFAVASALQAGKAIPFRKKSIELKDGADGSKGGIGILRAATDAGSLCLVMKYADQGMSHGYFDRLSFSLYDERDEVAQDYGAARWVNIDQKDGGGYLPENKTFAKQSIAHNTVVVDEKSQFNGHFEAANAHHSEPYFFLGGRGDVQAASAKEFNAYPGAELHRTMIVLKVEAFELPVVVVVFRVSSEEPHQYDLPYYFQGHLLTAGFEYETELEKLQPLGTGYGYQHLWKEATGKASGPGFSLQWFGRSRFYTLACRAGEADELIFARTGANDPDFNLRRDPAVIIRKKNSTDALFFS
ncbi:MAG: heparinase II/III family protein [Phaeodactylibacter sp.]|nr:heparinase II/III family protein [Phaeodactylibacter sp.]